MRGSWVDIEINDQDEDFVLRKKKPARAYFRDCVLKYVNKRDLTRGIGIVYMADFIYFKDSQKIVKNRMGSIEDLHDLAENFMALKHHENEQVRKLIEKAEILAALTED